MVETHPQTALNPGKMTVSVVHQELRDATAAPHQSLEKRLPFVSDDLDRGDYRRLLEAYYGFYFALERQLDQVSDLDTSSLIGRHKAAALAQDLEVLGLTPEQIAALELCHELPPLNNRLQALGVMYVMEGATLGGQVLSRIVKAKLSIESDSGGAFLNVYGSAAGPMWRSFLALLSGVDDPIQRDQIVQSALLTFTSFERWLERSQVLR
ncbi:biliverdin-producing heme oxygenase [Pseudomonas sp. G.S.17]|uniref:biliverdin-producing heme oxygenase n=1 Tax=Pseudomonas sp. G.S.17 TaxID=3137451 RepID=UPI00311CDE2B